ncbi:MAG TPA: DUF58 domain-containing protein [Dehalococcoidales bacterium]|nr:DUF58 domain-containing protein [Dehalococcoidales bacterium]
MEERFSSQPVGYLFGRFGLLLVLAGLLLAAWYGQLVIVIVLGLVLSAAGISKFWSRYSLVGVSCERWLSERRVFPGEYIELRLRLANRKLLPLPWIQLDDEIPVNFTPEVSLAPSSKPGFGFLSKTAALLWYTRVSWKQRLYGNRRGYYALGPIVLTSGDIFGFYPRSVIQPLVDHVIVYPRIFSIAQLGIPPLYPIGEATAELRIFEDPIRVIGVRDYSPHDSRRRIHWKASARHQSLQVKVFEPTTLLNVAIFLVIDSFKVGSGEEDFELGISTAASAANHLIERRSSVGLFANSRLADSGQPVEILPGSSTGQLVEMLESLAKVTHEASVPFEKFWQAEQARLPWGTTLVFILSTPLPSLTDLLVSLKESRHRLMVLQVGDQAERGIEPAIAWHNIRAPGDFVKAGGETR